MGWATFWAIFLTILIWSPWLKLVSQQQVKTFFL
jgi:hypothetical protein